MPKRLDGADRRLVTLPLLQWMRTGWFLTSGTIETGDDLKISDGEKLQFSGGEQKSLRTKNNFERLPDGFFGDVDEWFL